MTDAIEVRCPKCGGEMVPETNLGIVTSEPPTGELVCQSCGHRIPDAK
jgi:DNA-directed RNA polymerase subunit RPC12/RpoP